jgi:uncharacterized protein (DUF39 family)
MSADWLKGASMFGYGVTLSVGIGIPIPILDEEIAHYTSVRDEQIITQIVDYSKAYPERMPDIIGRVNYAELKSGKIKIADKEVPTGNLSSYAKAQQITEVLKDWIKKGKFLLTEPIASLPNAESGYTFKSLEIKEIKGGD